MCGTSLLTDPPPAAHDSVPLWSSVSLQAPSTTAEEAPLGSAPAAPTSASPAAVPLPRRSGALKAVAGVLAAVVLVGGLIAVASGGGDEEVAADPVTTLRSSTTSRPTVGTRVERNEASATSPPPVATTPAPPPPPTAPPTPPPVVTTLAPPLVGDLAIPGVAMVRPPCDGSYIVSIGSWLTSDRTPPAENIGGQLSRAPGTRYFRTDQSCTSLRQVMPDGAYIYVVVFGPYPDLVSACAQLSTARAIEPSAFVRRLTNTPDGAPLENEICG